MCGILGVATTRGRMLSVDRARVEAMRDLLAHRGPDGAGLWSNEHAMLAHRRLAVVDCTAASAQPRVVPGAGVLVYNGELYNDAELRAELSALGTRFESHGDAETIAHALSRWGSAAFGKLRGMYAIAWLDLRSNRLTLARDPLGIKPLFYALPRVNGGRELIFASEAHAILAHPAMPRRPDALGVMGYLTTIRTTTDDHTVFEGVFTLRPGERLEFDLTAAPLDAPSLRETLNIDLFRTPAMPSTAFVPATSGSPASRTRGCIEDSLSRHLRADVPTCCLLSGGLDSTILTSLAARSASARGESIYTYCSGAKSPPSVEATVHAGGLEARVSAGEETPANVLARMGAESRPPALADDFSFARLAAQHLGTIHAEAPVSRELFADRWERMVHALGTPLSTPNEVAINEVARRLRADGKIVAISGEGADELFAGYSIPLLAAAAFHGRGGTDGGAFALDETGWIAPAGRWAVLNRRPEREDAASALLAHYRAVFDSCVSIAHGDALGAHLVMQRRINLAGLLGRLDTSMMLEGVEGRTPFADVSVAALAESLAMDEKLRVSADGKVDSKSVLRRAFAGDVPAPILTREKASFPLPFQQWMVGRAGIVRGSALVREWFTPEAIEVVERHPDKAWCFAWPMLNIALWERRWWG